MPPKTKVLIFDVNETLLNLSKIRISINEALGSEAAFSIWFSTLLHYSLVETISGTYHTFGEIGKATLLMVARNLKKSFTDYKAECIIKMMTELPAHTDVIDGLTMLQNAGYRMFALTNSSLPAAKEQIKYAGIDTFFQQIYSVDEFKVFKPHPKTYLGAAQNLGVMPEDCIMIAAHAWDLAGAKKAGLVTAFIERNGQSIYPLSPVHDFTGQDLKRIAEQLIKPL